MTFASIDLIFLGVTALAAFLGARATVRPKPDTAQMARLERKLDLVLNHLGLVDNPALVSNVLTTVIGSTYSASVTEDIMDLIRQGKKINAIKLYRELNGVGLKEAKDAVAQIERTAF